MRSIDELIVGYKKFFSKYFIRQSKLYESLSSKGQKPKILVISCSDSRVDPSILTQADPGDIFVIRHVANLVPVYEAKTKLHSVGAALEYAVCVLKITDIIVLGHSDCGGIKALLNEDMAKNSDFISNWLSIGKKIKEKILKEHIEKPLEEIQSIAEKENILLSMQNLNTFPWIAKRIKEKKLNIHGWYFNIQSGRLSRYKEEENQFMVF